MRKKNVFHTGKIYRCLVVTTLIFVFSLSAADLISTLLVDGLREGGRMTGADISAVRLRFLVSAVITALCSLAAGILSGRISRGWMNRLRRDFGRGSEKNAAEDLAFIDSVVVLFIRAMTAAPFMVLCAIALSFAGPAAPFLAPLPPLGVFLFLRLSALGGQGKINRSLSLLVPIGMLIFNYSIFIIFKVADRRLPAASAGGDMFFPVIQLITQALLGIFSILLLFIIVPELRPAAARIKAEPKPGAALGAAG